MKANLILQTLTRLFALLLILTFALPVHAADSRLVGTVVDATTGRPLVAARIQIRQADKEIATLVSDAAGSYASPTLPVGLVSVSVTLEGYREAEENGFRLIADKTMPLNFSLQQLRVQIEEVIVTARATQMSPYGSVAATSLNREEIRRAPGTAGDVFRGLNTLPGVSATGEFSDFTVRGRGPRDNLILIDGLPYDRLVHFDQSLGEEDDLEGGGRFSIFGQNVVGEAAFQPGGWEAAEGGSNGSLLKLAITEGNPETPFTSVKLDLAGGEILYDGPAVALDNTTVLLSLRHYNFGWLFETIGEEDLGAPKLSDFIFKSVSHLNAKTTVKLIGLYTPEHYTRKAKNVLASENFQDTNIINSEQHAGMLGVVVEYLMGNSGRLRNAVYYRSADDDNSQGEAFPERSPLDPDADELFVEDPIITLNEADSETGWRLDYRQSNRFGEFSAGSRLSYLTLDYERAVTRDYPVFTYDTNDFRADPLLQYAILSPAFYNTRLEESATRGAVYLDQAFESGPYSLRPGVRVDYDGLLDTTYISPRFQANWQYRAETRFSLTGGLYYQPPRLLEIAANPANIDLEPERSSQISLGVEHYFNRDYRLLVETYYQQLDDLIVENDQVTGRLANDADGWSAGLDALLSRRFLDSWSATLRYSYNHSVTDRNDGRGEIPTDFNRPHLASMTVSYEPNDRWALSGQYQISSGRPSDDFIIYNNVLNDLQNLRYSREITLRNTGRHPSFQTLNIRVDYRRSFKAMNIIGFIDVINVLGRANVDEQEFSPRTGEVEIDGLDTFPQLGLTLEF